MNANKPIYNTKKLAGYGLYLLVILIVIFPLGRFFIPPFTVKQPTRQLATLNGLSVKFNDSPAVSLFLRSIKSHHGYLCLGTSESDKLPDGNYYDFLNNDTAIQARFSILAGAGRTCGLYIPLLLDHRKEVDSLNIIYFINPVYWRTDLADVNTEYWNRYNNYKVCTDIALTPEEEKQYYQPVTSYINKLDIIEKATYTLEYELRQYRKSFFQDLKYNINPKLYLSSLSYIANKKKPLTGFNNFGKPDYKNIDTTWNINKSFTHKEWFKPIDDTVTYRYKELTSFITTCRNLGINALFIVGPYNGRFITEYSPASLAGYQQTTNNIRNLLTAEKVNFIDASNQSYTAGAFMDHQHHSSYGAYLIYKELKILLNEKKLN